MKRRLIILTALVALLVGVLGPASLGRANAAAPERSHAAAVHTAAHAQAFDKTRFVAHLGVAAFLIHYIYKKYKQGKLSRHHLFTLIKAAAAGLFAFHELKKAYDIANSSNSKLLHAIIKPFQATMSAASDMATRLKHGDTSTVSKTYSENTSFDSAVQKNGYPVKEVSTNAGF